LDRRRLASDDHCLEVEDVLLEPHLHAALLRRHRDLLVLESDVADQQRRGTYRRIQRELPPLVRDRGDGRADHGDGRPRDGLPRSGARHLPADGTLLGERGADADAQAQRERAEPSALDHGSSIPSLRDVTVGNPGRSGASLRAIRAVRKEAENPGYAATPSLTLRRPPPTLPRRARRAGRSRDSGSRGPPRSG